MNNIELLAKEFQRTPEQVVVIAKHHSVYCGDIERKGFLEYMKTQLQDKYYCDKLLRYYNELY